MAPTRLRLADAAAEAVAAIVARPLRATLASLGTLLGVAWFVAALGLVSTAAAQVATTFAQLLATQVRVTQVSTGVTSVAYPYPADAERRLGALHGVLAAGVYWPLKLGRPVTVVAVSGPPGRPGSVPGTGPVSEPATGHPGLPVIAASPGFLGAAGVQVSQGRLFDSWDQAKAAPVCLVGAFAAKSLGISGLRREPVVFIDNVPCVAIGIIGRAVRQPAVLQSILMPSSAAIAIWGEPDVQAGAQPTVLIQTRPGAAAVVARLAPFAISQATPQQFRVTVPPGPVLLHEQVNGTLGSLFATIGWISLGIGLLSIAVVSLIRALARTPEYALRRAIGARRLHIVAHAASESAIIGLIGGLAGASLGLAVVVLVGYARHWVPVVAPLTVLLAPAAGAAAAILAGIGPAIYAARSQPTRGLRGFPGP